jgi:hypothetical protein
MTVSKQYLAEIERLWEMLRSRLSWTFFITTMGLDFGNKYDHIIPLEWKFYFPTRF